MFVAIWRASSLVRSLAVFLQPLVNSRQLGPIPSTQGREIIRLSREMAIKQSNLQQRRLVQILADPKSMQNRALHYFFSYLTDFDVVMRKLISE
jgi:hypothetical protein